MISPELFFNTLRDNGVNYFTGVPDSLLKHFCSYVDSNVDDQSHTIAANEGAALSIAIGYHFASNNMPLVYMQNSGLGNIINPLTSLADPAIYSVPMLLMIGWRGEPGVKDEPQHVKQGRVTLELLDALEIPYMIIDAEVSDIKQRIKIATESAQNQGCAHALVIRKNTFTEYRKPNESTTNFGWQREDAIKMIVDATNDTDIIVSTTGMASRELFEYRAKNGQHHHQDFLTVGGMGHASQIALGIAQQKKNNRVICIDGDGAALMHLGSLAITGVSKLNNFKHIILNNGAHDSVGGQPTVAFEISLSDIAKACGYQVTNICDSHKCFNDKFKKFLDSKGPSIIEIRVDKGNRKDLGRPTSFPLENKQNFMNFLSNLPA